MHVASCRPSDDYRHAARCITYNFIGGENILNAKIIVAALVIIVAVPIGLGYAFAVEDVEHTSYEVTNSFNATDQLNNSLHKTYGMQQSYQNNYKCLWYEGSAAGLSGTITTISPDYAVLGPTYTSIRVGDDYADWSGGWTVPGQSGLWAWYTGIETKQVTLTFTPTFSSEYYFSTDGIMTPYSSSGAFKIYFVQDPNGYLGTRYNVYVSRAVSFPSPEFPVLAGTFDIPVIITNPNFKPSLRVTFSDADILVDLYDHWPTVTENNPIAYCDYVQSLNGSRYSRDLITTGAAFNLLQFKAPNVQDIYRIDSANLNVSSYPVIVDNTYIPDNLHTDYYELNITKPDILGTQIGFAGVAYSVVGDKLYVGGVGLSCNNLSFRSIYNGATYDNYIGDIAVSETATQSPVAFFGEWSMIVTASVLEPQNWTSSEWQPGVFAWDGIDINFAMTGLVACAAAFIGLGLVGARSGAKIGWLALICGSAAAIFLCLI